MSDDVTIRCDGIGKLYRIGPSVSYGTLRDVIAKAIKTPWRRREPIGESERPRDPVDAFWALRDVSFEVRRGEVVGLIGRNGAGKSTMLRILARITEPTEGHARVRGRVGSLLEVGTGFHPELSGRENIYFNGAILGMRRAEIARQFDEIVAFAGVGSFIDMPVKRYSSGMHLRLAFSVAAHLEAEVLLVDEVLAVGDLAFQKKCLGKINDVTRSGKTVVLVSHQLNQIRRLCSSCLWLESGRLQRTGPAAEVIGAYEIAQTSAPDGDGRHEEHSGLGGRFLRWQIRYQDGEPHILKGTGPVELSFSLRMNREVRGHHGIGLYNADGLLIWATAVTGLDLEPGVVDLVHRLPGLPVSPGVYRWRVSMWDHGQPVDIWDCHPEMVIATEPMGHYMDAYQGVLNLRSEFSVREVSPASV